MKNNKILISAAAAFLFIVIRLSVYGEPLILSLSNSFFFLGLITMLAGLAAVVDILGLFKSFGYILHRRRIKAENVQRKKDGEVPVAIPGLADYLESRDYIPVKVIIGLLLSGAVFWILSFAFSILSMNR